MTSRGRRNLIVLAFLAAVAALAGAVWRYGYGQALEQLARRAEGDLALASDRLSTQLQVYRELAVLMADHPALEGLDDPARARAAQALLLRVADKTAALDVVYARADGRVLAAARGITGPDLRGAVHRRLDRALALLPPAGDVLRNYDCFGIGPLAGPLYDASHAGHIVRKIGLDDLDPLVLK